MPAALERCVTHVMGKGHDQSSAFAICRSAMDLAADGSQDGMAPDMTDPEMQKMVEPMMKKGFSLADQAVLYKDVVIAHAGTNFKNGDTEFDLTIQEMDEMVKNFTAYPRQVPVLLGGEHALGPDRADRPASGWVESIRRSGNDLWARLKLIGAGAAAIASDAFRGASIGAYQPPDLHGNPVGWRLDHLLITNAPFFTDLNIAARAARGGSRELMYLTEAKMAEKKEEKPDPASKADDSLNLTEKLTAAEVLLQQKEGLIRDLTATNAVLLEEVKAFKESPSLELAMKELEKVKLNNLAEKVRRITAKMRIDNQIDRATLQGWYDHDSDAVVLAGFKASQFKGSMDLLQYHRDSVPKRPGDRRFMSGEPGDEPTTYTAEQQQQIRAQGKDPELLAKVRGAKNFTEYKRRKEAATKG
jgi:hypothetical protein